MTGNGAATTYPVNLLLRDRPCLVVGGGPVAARKVVGLLAAGARVRVVAARVEEDLRRLAAAGRLELVQRPFLPADLTADLVLVFAATDDRRLNAAVLAAARRRRILGCAVDGNWPAGDFITPAVCRRQGVTVAVATGGRDRRLARRLRLALEGLLPELLAKK